MPASKENTINRKVSVKSKEEGKDQESIQSSTTPDPEHHLGKWQKHTKTSQYKRAKEIICSLLEAYHNL